jgi:hypothetical protein
MFQPQPSSTDLKIKLQVLLGAQIFLLGLGGQKEIRQNALNGKLVCCAAD